MPENPKKLLADVIETVGRIQAHCDGKTRDDARRHSKCLAANRRLITESPGHRKQKTKNSAYDVDDSFHRRMTGFGKTRRTVSKVHDTL